MRLLIVDGSPGLAAQVAAWEAKRDEAVRAAEQSMAMQAAIKVEVAALGDADAVRIGDRVLYEWRTCLVVDREDALLPERLIARRTSKLVKVRELMDEANAA